MKIRHQMVCDLSHPYGDQVITVMRGDCNTRVVEMMLLDNGQPWTVPPGTTASLAGSKPDGTKVWYDTLPTNQQACTLQGSTVVAELAPQLLTAPGTVSAAIVLRNKTKLDRLTTFPFRLRVLETPGTDVISNDYYAVKDLSAVNDEFARVWAAIKAVIDDQAVSAGSTWSSQKVSDEIAKVDAFGRNNFASAIRETLRGPVVTSDMVSPVEHEVECLIESKNMLSDNVFSGGDFTVYNGKRCFKYLDNYDGVAIRCHYKEKTQYAITLKAYRKDGDNRPLSFNVCYSDGSLKSYLQSTGPAWQPVKYITDAGKTVTEIKGVFVHGGTCYLDLTESQITEGNGYQPYIPPVSDLSTVKVFRYGKNFCGELLPVAGKYPGVTAEKKDDGTYRFDGTATQAYGMSVARVTLPPGKYELSGNTRLDGVDFNIEFASGKFASDRGSGATFTVTETRLSKVTFVIQKGVMIHATIKPMIRLASTPPEFEPYDGETLTPNKDGVVSGVSSTARDMTITTDNPNVTVEATYNVDLVGYIDRKLASLQIIKERL